MGIKTFAERLRESRELSGYGSAELSVAVGMSRGLVSEIERGNVQQVRADTAIALARALGVRVEWLVLGDGPRT